MSIYNVPRCQHLKVNGTQCGSPALKRNRFCFFHKRFQEERIKLNSDRVRRGRADLYLPVLEDANSIQVSLMQIMRLLASRQIDSKIASLLLYALQTASCNLRHTTFEPGYIRDVVIDRLTIDQTSIGCDQWSEEDFPDPEEAEEEEPKKEKAKPAVATTRVGTAALGYSVERSSTPSATKPSVQKIQAPNPPPAQSAKKQPATAQNKSAQPSRAAATQPDKRKEPKKDLEQVREKIRGMARDWIMQTAKEGNHKVVT